MIATSLLKFINNKKFLFFAVVVFLLPFILFCFWNVPAADDYMIFSRSLQYSFWGLQAWIYRTWSGRYFSTFLSTVFSYNGFLYSHYYVHTILLLAGTVLSWIFLLKKVNKYFLLKPVSCKSLLLVSLLLLIFEINTIPEPVTAFYWFSSAITYQVPLILLIVLSAVLIELLYSPQKKSYILLSALLIVLLHGCNESMTLFVLIMSTCAVFCYYFIYKHLPGLISGLYFFSLVNSCFLLFAPGIINRSALIGSSSFLSIIGIAVIKFIIHHWYFLKEPLWWACLFFSGSFVLTNPGLHKQLLSQRLSFPLILLLYIATGICIYIPILYVTNGSLPLRTENTICFLYSLMSVIIVVVFLSSKLRVSQRPTPMLYKYRYVLVAILIFSTANMKKVTDSLLSGLFYKQVMQERIDMLEAAKRQQVDEVNLDDYQTAVTAQIRKYPFLNRHLFKEIIVKPPPIICFQNDFYDLSYIKELYSIKKMTINKRDD